jgi:hypothetical protein
MWSALFAAIINIVYDRVILGGRQTLREKISNITLKFSLAVQLYHGWMESEKLVFLP